MVGAGAGSVNREQFLKGQAATADGLEREGMASRLRSFESCPHARPSRRRTRADSPNSSARPASTMPGRARIWRAR